MTHYNAGAILEVRFIDPWGMPETFSEVHEIKTIFTKL
jgi:hypothetical protein